MKSSAAKYAIPTELGSQPVTGPGKGTGGIGAARPAWQPFSTIPEMRRFLAVKGCRELREAIERDIAGKSGADALHALMLSMRRYALERPEKPVAAFPDHAFRDVRDNARAP